MALDGDDHDTPPSSNPSHEGGDDNTLPTRAQIFDAFIKGVRDIPIVLTGTEGGKHSPARTTYNHTTLSQAPQPFIQIIDNAMRLAFGKAPLSTTSDLVLGHLLQQAHTMICSTMSDVSQSTNEFSSAKARELGQLLAHDFLPPGGIHYKELSHLAGFYADVFDPVDLGTVSIPQLYDEVMIHHYAADEHGPEAIEAGLRNNPIDEDERQPKTSLSFSEYTDDPLTLHPYVETRDRINAMYDRLCQHSDKLFHLDIDFVGMIDPDQVSKKIAIVEQFKNDLIAEAKQHILSGEKDALYRQALDLSPSARANIFMQSITLARDVATTPEDLAIALAKGSEFRQHLYNEAIDNTTPDGLIQLPATHHKTVSGALIGEDYHLYH